MAPAACAQQAPAESYAGFEGRPVVAVDLTARPTMDQEAFRPLVKQKAGQPFSIAAIKETVAALQATQEFSQVQVSIEPQAAGLRVLFILSPSYYIGLVSFPGADTRFAYTVLLQAINIPQQSPYVEAQIPDAKQKLVQFFAANGYFAAAVETETQMDDAHRNRESDFPRHA